MSGFTYPLFIGPPPRNRYEWCLSLIPILGAALLVVTSARAVGAAPSDRRPNWAGCIAYSTAYVVYITAGVSLAVQNELGVQMYSGPIQIWYGWRNPLVSAAVWGISATLMGLVNAICVFRIRREKARR